MSKVRLRHEPRDDPGARCGVVTGAIDDGQAAIRTVTAEAIMEHGEISGRALEALFAMRQAEVIVRALELAGYEFRRQG
jgi:hypothetical protein